MGLIHTPRVVASIGRGLYKRRMAEGGVPPTKVGIGEENKHIYKARLGLFDVDYLGHLNKCVN